MLKSITDAHKKRKKKPRPRDSGDDDVVRVVQSRVSRPTMTTVVT